MPEILNGLKLEDFIHPDDLAAINALHKEKGIDKLVSIIEDKSNQMVIRMRTLGSCVRLNEHTSPEIFAVVKDVCEIMDYDKIPEIYSARKYDFEIVPRGVDTPTLLISDVALRELKRPELYFEIGRAVTRLKSDYLKFYTAALIMAGAADYFPVISDAVKIPLANWMRKSELTADRGGLLACQDFKTAIRCLMQKAGMPLSETEDIDILSYIESTREKSKLVLFGKGMKTFSNTKGWINDRIVDLFNWYSEGNYDNLLEKYI